ncbi:MAG: glycosyltransferase family 2 protein [Actinomycetota bacterium]|nr:glycosyltransferase family 2 protein [Actinomycetota bacterium]
MTGPEGPPAPGPELSAVIVLYNSAAVIAECVASIPAGVEVVIVDNASGDDGAARALAARPDALLVPSERNLGFGGGCNLGWKRATGTYVAFINPDVRIRPNALELLVARLEREPHGMAGPAMLEQSGAPRRCNRRPTALADFAQLLPAAGRWGPAFGLDGKLKPDDPIHRLGGVVARLEGACLLVRRSDLAAIGGFDEDLFLYGEEDSLALALAALGGRAIYVPEAQVEHAGAHSTTGIGATATVHYYRSRVLIYRKRDGNLRGWLAAGLLAFGGLLSLPIALVNSLLHRQRALRLDLVRSQLRGVAQGAFAHRRSGRVAAGESRS